MKYNNNFILSAEIFTELKNGVFWAVTPCGSCVLTRATRRNNPEDTILHSHRRENLKSYILLSCLPNKNYVMNKQDQRNTFPAVLLLRVFFAVFTEALRSSRMRERFC
jgi:hypothetical protein